jgi:HEAT repeat protein
VEPLIAALNDEESGVRDAAVAILGKIGGAQAVEPLRVALGHQQEDARKADIWAGGNGRESGQ